MSTQEKLNNLHQKLQEHPVIGKRIGNLDPTDSSFYTFASLFDKNADGDISDNEFKVAIQILERLRNIDRESLRTLTAILRELDVNGNTTTDTAEAKKLFEIFNTFCGADSDNNTLNHTELEKALNSLS